jgi:hypothetical protein
MAARACAPGRPSPAAVCIEPTVPAVRPWDRDPVQDVLLRDLELGDLLGHLPLTRGNLPGELLDILPHCRKVGRHRFEMLLIDRRARCW